MHRVAVVDSFGKRPAGARRVALKADRGKPRMMGSHHGAEFTWNAILASSNDHNVEWHYIK